MKSSRVTSGMDRRHFLAATGGGLLAAAVPVTGDAAAFVTGKTTGTASGSPARSTAHSAAPETSSMRKIPIGVFDPVYKELSLDAMLDKVSALGLEAMEIGTGGYPEAHHCPMDELLQDAGKAKAWQKKFEDRGIHVATLSCHGNPIHPDPEHAKRDAETFRKTVLLAERLGVKVIVGFSGCPGGSASDPQPNWVTYCWPPEYAAMQDWQWKERVVPYWTFITPT
jgi:hypothetical protein